MTEQMQVKRTEARLRVKGLINSQMMNTDSEIAKSEGTKLVGVNDERIANITKERLDHRYKYQSLEASQAAAAKAAAEAKQQAKRDFMTARQAHYVDDGGLAPKDAAQRALEETNLKFDGIKPTGTTPYVSRKATEKLMLQDAKGGAGSKDAISKAAIEAQAVDDKLASDNAPGVSHLGSMVGSLLPRFIAPESNRAKDAVARADDEYAAQIRVAGERMQPEFIQDTIKRLRISDTDLPEAERNKRIIERPLLLKRILAIGKARGENAAANYLPTASELNE